MGMLRWLASRFDRGEERASPTSWDLLGTLDGYGPQVNARAAENLATVFACVQTIASAIGSLPALVYRRGRDARVEDQTHALTRLVREGPNARQTWPDFIEWLMASTLLRGNGLAEVIRDGAGDVVGFDPIPWDWVTVQLLPTNRLAFDVTAPVLTGKLGRRRRLLQDDVLHLKDRTDDGLVGRSRLGRAADVVANAVNSQAFASSFFKNAANPSGAIKIDRVLNDQQFDRIRDQVERRYAGVKRAGRIMVLENGMSWQQMSISPEDAELLDSRRFSVEELCRIYQCPPPLIQDYSHNTFTNSETAGRWFAQFTIGPWARKIEAEFARSVFEADGVHELELDLSGFLRGDPLTRWQSYDIALKNGVLAPNEVRQVEGWNRRAGGDFAQPAAEPRV